MFFEGDFQFKIDALPKGALGARFGDFKRFQIDFSSILGPLWGPSGSHFRSLLEKWRTL